MTFRDLRTVVDASERAFSESVPMHKLPCGECASLRYPKFPPLMRFAVHRYAAERFGNVFTMYTRAMGGRMQLATLVFTPNLGADVPLLLVDVMAMGKKRAAFVEYYDCTASHAADFPLLTETAARHASLPDYPEKPAWYIGSRAPYSLIKGGADDAALLAMLADSVAAYAKTCAAQTEAREGNQEGLHAFVERMVAEGNPSSATMERVLGKARAERFFREAIMPAAYTTKELTITV